MSAAEVPDWLRLGGSGVGVLALAKAVHWASKAIKFGAVRISVVDPKAAEERERLLVERAQLLGQIELYKYRLGERKTPPPVVVTPPSEEPT